MRWLAFLGRQGRWVLPAGLVAGVLMPWAAQPLRQAIPWFTGVLLFLAVLRLLPDAQQMTEMRSLRVWLAIMRRILMAQLLLPIAVFFILTLAEVPYVWSMAATLVAAAPPISGSPNLVLLLQGNSALAMRWLMLGTVLMPVTCLPILWLLQPGQSITIMLAPALVLLGLIGSSVLLAVLVMRYMRWRRLLLRTDVLDGISALSLALMVIGLMSALHSPNTDTVDIVQMLLLAVFINVGYQCLGVLASRFLRQRRFCAIGTGVVYGNRNIALYLAALPAVQVEPLLLFIACYQVPMYLTPLIGDQFYSRLE